MVCRKIISITFKCTRDMKTIRLTYDNYKETVKAAAAFLKKGETIVLPTDTIYGLACGALNEKAVEKLFRIKERDRRKGLPVFVNSFEMARRFAYIDKKKEEFLRKIFPGRITVILHAKDTVPRLATGGKDTIALRMPSDKFILDLIAVFGKPITGTSANISGIEPIKTANEAIKQWSSKKAKPALIIDDGEILGNTPSTIIDLTGQKPIILRQGIISKKELDNYLN